MLGINYKDGEQVITRTVTGKTKAFKKKIKLILKNEKIELESLFIESDEMPFNLLGLKDFFDKFQITFDSKKKKLTLNKYWP